MLLPDATTLGKLLAMDIGWQFSRREQGKTIVTQHNISEITVRGDKIRIEFSQSAKKPAKPPVFWEWIATARAVELQADNEMTMQSCGSYFGPNENYALIPDSSSFWLAPDEWPKRPDGRHV